MSENKKTASKPKFLEGWDFDNIAKLIYIMIVCVCGMFMRHKLMPHTSRDMWLYLERWYNYFAEHGGFKAVGDDVGDYTPLYYYYIAALTYFKDISAQTGLKILSIVFDFITAIYAMWIVELADKKSKNPHLPVIAFTAVFCLPTVVLNSATWGQCDVIYSCFLVMCLYYMMKGKDNVAMIMFGISFSFKLQAIFFAPFIGIALFKKKIRPLNLLWIPAVYVISIIPATIAGGDFFRLLTVYFRQSGQYEDLCMSLPNLWTLWEEVENELLGPAGIFFAGACVVTVMYYYITKKELKLTNNTMVALAMISSFVVPFVLPHMHERYFYLSEVMFVIFAFCYRSRLWLIFTSQYCSVQALSGYLFGKGSMDRRFLLLIEIVNIVVVYLCLKKEMEEPRDEEVVMCFEKQAAKS
ncbi:glycosyltransferase 87 family protein [Ruminococcus albus]|uniref:Mannosyltransferase related to Gpi18 n=1 Tax=Ruminococcus albus TaxID=1264 RepID=A0A1H7N3N5_RUMAL|nr:glycosyltransferase 87 family protein [Ruminococcus albus]SEL17477.1 Mannosyltransferase related to Gpi18 [Ruminococcus albus]